MEGSRQLARWSAAYVACLAFAVGFLATNLLGSGPMAGLERGLVAAAGGWVIGYLLGRVLVAGVVDAMARNAHGRAKGDRA